MILQNYDLELRLDDNFAKICGVRDNYECKQLVDLYLDLDSSYIYIFRVLIKP